MASSTSLFDESSITPLEEEVSFVFRHAKRKFPLAKHV